MEMRGVTMPSAVVNLGASTTPSKLLSSRSLPKHIVLQVSLSFHVDPLPSNALIYKQSDSGKGLGRIQRSPCECWGRRRKVPKSRLQASSLLSTLQQGYIAEHTCPLALLSGLSQWPSAVSSLSSKNHSSLTSLPALLSLYPPLAFYKMSCPLSGLPLFSLSIQNQTHPAATPANAPKRKKQQKKQDPAQLIII